MATDEDDQLPYLHAILRNIIFDGDKLSSIETLYANAFKEATASGESSRGAHFKALTAVYEHGRQGKRPLRSELADLFSWCATKLRRGS